MKITVKKMGELLKCLRCNLQRCIQSASLSPGTHSFPFWTNVYANYERKEKHENGVFYKEIAHSHFSQWRNDQVP